jgi:predicted DNA repair protein MutK
MASGIFAIFDDIAALMDDVAAASKIATSKTAGILGDDLAVNAEKATGFVSSRELPVLWSITKGSLLNKAIIVPIVLLLNAFFPEVIKYVLIIGGCYLAFEGIEKVVEFLFHRKHDKNEAAVVTVVDAGAAAIEEKAKVKSAITTDFILSVEIVIIALSTVLKEALLVQIITVCVVSLVATVGVYGLVALIVRMDDAGFKLIKASNNKGPLNALGRILVNALPIIVKILSVVGTIALFLVSGHIFHDNMPQLHNGLPQGTPTLVAEIVFSVVAGLLVLLIVTIVKKIIALLKKA